MHKWYQEAGEQNDVVISTRVRLARSLPGYPYPKRMNAAGRQQVEQMIYEAATNENAAVGHQFAYWRMEDIGRTDGLSLAERRLVQPDFPADRMGGLLVTQDESLSLLVNGEDHLRIQVFRAGMELESAYAEADHLDTILDKELHFAFDPKLGYLTQDPANLGTGMRASVLLHLPALHESGSIGRIAAGLAKLGLVLEEEPFDPSNEEEQTSRYLLSNRLTLGLNEEEALRNLKSTAQQLLVQERTARLSLAEKLEMQDAVSRALGVLQSAKMLGEQELPDLLYRVRLGIAAGLISGVGVEKIDALLMELQPATLTLACGRRFSQSQRDGLRAEVVQRVLG